MTHVELGGQGPPPKLNIPKKPNMLKMAQKWPWLIFTILSYPPPTQHVHIQTDGDYTKHVVTPFGTTHLKSNYKQNFYVLFLFFSEIFVHELFSWKM